MMKWLSLIFSIILCFLSLQAIGQSELPDEVHLKNGSIFRGKIINYAPGENLSIKIANEQIIVLKEDEVEKILQSNMVIVESGKPIIQEKAKKSSEILPEVTPTEKTKFEYKTSGWYNVSYVGFYAGNEEQSGNRGGTDQNFKLGSGVHSIVGKQLSHLFGIGLGIGLDNYSKRSETILPVFVEIRGYPFKNVKKLYYATSLGYGFAFKRESFGITEADGGYLFHPAVGFRMGTADGSNVNIDLGMRFQKAFYLERLFSGDVDERDVVFRRFTIRVGLTLWK